ncbi:acyltransferase family protein [Nocardiopsis algeriensis]|uniref:acyltransferase family protein n=1 Tax=Nocardiopsis algeriensis TaxID=1478215 RepID=UPI003B431E5D
MLSLSPDHAARVPRTPAAPARARRPDIEGLRAVAVLLVAVYHIWFGKVSGGVDVFLLLTGFLITGSLVRAMERDGRIAFGAFLARLVKRLFPAGAVVLAAILVGAYLFLPRSRWTDIIADVQAAALYHANWHLAGNAVDYMARDSASSPVQHFWSLAIQGQFYLLWPVLITIAALLAARLGQGVRTAALTAVATVFAVSFGYSLWITATDPVWAYFDGGARLWELALGGVLALTIDRIRLSRRLRAAAGWLGLVALVLCGVVIGDTLPYPGYASLWPTLAALLILVAGADGENSRLSANRLLSRRPLVWLGGHAYTLFLWHWPALMFYLEVTDRVRPSLTGGLMVLGVSFVAAFATSWVVDDSVERLTRSRTAPSWSLAAGVLFVVPVLVAGLLWNQSIERGRQVETELSSDLLSYPGAAVHLDPELAAGLPALPVLPDTTTAARDTVAQTNDCNALRAQSEVRSCEFGNLESDYTVVLVGSSHARHWFHSLYPVAEQHGWRLVVMTKGNCQFSPEPQFLSGNPFPECEEWNAGVMEELMELRPDAVFTLGTLSGDEKRKEEHVPDGFVERWHQMDELGTDVVAIRDTPRFEQHVAECVDRTEARNCVQQRDRTLAETSPLEELDPGRVPDNTRFLDMTDYLCDDELCHGVIGNHLVYYDTDHFSHTFSKSLALVMEPHLLDALPGAPVGERYLAEATRVPASY